MIIDLKIIDYFNQFFIFFFIIIIFFSGANYKTFGWKFKQLSEEGITTLVTSDNSFTPQPTYIHNFKIAPKFEGNCLRQNKVFFFLHRSVVNFFMVYKLDTWLCDLNVDFKPGSFTLTIVLVPWRFPERLIIRADLEVPKRFFVFKCFSCLQVKEKHKLSFFVSLK